MPKDLSQEERSPLLTGNCFLNGLRWAKTQDIDKTLPVMKHLGWHLNRQPRGPLMILLKLVEVWNVVAAFALLGTFLNS